MRTIRVELQVQVDATSTMSVSTEVIVADEKDLVDAGREARAAVDAFVAGYVEESP